MGAGNSTPEFQATDYVLNYSVNLKYPDQYGEIIQHSGPGIHNFPEQTNSNKVLADFNETLQSTSLELAAQYAKHRQNLRILSLLSLVSLILWVVGAVMVRDLELIFLWLTPMAVFWASLVVCCLITSKRNAAALAWRAQIVETLNSKMSAWAAMYPELTFTIIYPVEVWKSDEGGGTLVAVWCYVRVTQGPCQTGDKEPIYATTTEQQPQMVQPMVPEQVAQQQPQTAMVQGPNGQMDQGTPAVIDGED